MLIRYDAAMDYFRVESQSNSIHAEGGHRYFDGRDDLVGHGPDVDYYPMDSPVRYPKERLEYFDKVHFISALCAFSLLTVTFLIKFAIGLYSERY